MGQQRALGTGSVIPTPPSRLTSDHPNGTGRRREAPLICFTHLRWNFVWQRPQHLLTRMARRRPVFIVEEPSFDRGENAPRLRVACEAGVTVLTPCLPRSDELPGGFSARANGTIRTLLSGYFAGDRAPMEAIVWYYTPMALGALPPDIMPSLVVYDAMDELKNFLGAPRALQDQEQALLETANLVFAGGPSLYRARRHRHPRVFCFPSGVDAAHFRYGHTPPDDLATIPKPMIGFYGVLDERIDLGLLDQVAEHHPEWSVVLIGPIAKIDEQDLPRRPNIHYPGKRSYEELPAYLAQFDVAMLPFALNEATRCISPTKTLEYLAGGKPVVATPVQDVVDLYGDVVQIAETPDAFISAIEHLLREPNGCRASRERRVEAILSEHDWDVIAAQMQGLMQDALAGAHGGRWMHTQPAAAGTLSHARAGAPGTGA